MKREQGNGEQENTITFIQVEVTDEHPWIACPVCKLTTYQRKHQHNIIKNNYQFTSMAELVKDLVESVQKQACEACGNGEGEKFMALCQGCYGAMNNRPTYLVRL